MNFYSQPNYLTIYNGEEFWTRVLHTSQKAYLENFDEGTLETIKKDVIQAFDERFGTESDKMMNFEVLMLICIK